MPRMVLLQEYSPLLDQAGRRERTNQEGRRVAFLKDLWQGKITVPGTLAIITRVVRLLHHLMETLVVDKAAFQSRTQLVNCVLPLTGTPAAAFVTDSTQEF